MLISVVRRGEFYNPRDITQVSVAEVDFFNRYQVMPSRLWNIGAAIDGVMYWLPDYASDNQQEAIENEQMLESARQDAIEQAENEALGRSPQAKALLEALTPTEARHYDDNEPTTKEIESMLINRPETQPTVEYRQYDLFGDVVTTVPPTHDAWVGKLTWGFENETVCYNGRSYMENKIDEVATTHGSNDFSVSWEVVEDCSIETGYDDYGYDCDHECEAECECDEIYRECEIGCECDDLCECKDTTCPDCDAYDFDNPPYSVGLGILTKTHSKFIDVAGIWTALKWDTDALRYVYGIAMQTEPFFFGRPIPIAVPIDDCQACVSTTCEACIDSKTCDYCDGACECDGCTAMCYACTPVADREISDCSCSVCNEGSGCLYCRDIAQERQAELISPVFDAADDFEAVQESLDALERVVDYEVNDSCGLHVHVGVRELGLGQLKSVVCAFLDTQGSLKEMIAIDRRCVYRDYAHDLRVSKQDVMACSTRSALSALPRSRYTKLNLEPITESKQTLEFRMHEATKDNEELVNWARFCVGFVSYYSENAYNNEPLEGVIRRAASQVKDGDKVIAFYRYLFESN